MEIEALRKLLQGDKAASATMRRLTPSIRDKVTQAWKRQSKFTRLCAVVGLVVVAAILVLKVAMVVLVAVSLHDTPLGTILNVIISITMGIIGGLVSVVLGAFYIAKGKTFRDKVKGPSPSGVELLRNIIKTSDPDSRNARLQCLDNMLGGHEADTEHKMCLSAIRIVYSDG